MWTVFEWCYDAWYVNPAFIFNLTNDGWLLLKRGMLVCRWYYLLPFVPGHWFSWFFFFLSVTFLFSSFCLKHHVLWTAFLSQLLWTSLKCTGNLQESPDYRLDISGHILLLLIMHSGGISFSVQTNKQIKKNIVAFFHFLKIQLQGF